MRPRCAGEFTMPQHEFVTLSNTQLIGITQSYTCKLESPTSVTRCAFSSGVISSAIHRRFRPRCTVCTNRVLVSRKMTSKRSSTTALTPEMANGHPHNSHPIILEGGEYVMFTYEGLGSGLQEFILTVYGTCMPMLNLTRRKGLDIERFFLRMKAGIKKRRFQLRCEYLIPDSSLTL